VPIFSYAIPIESPPDEFMVVFNTSSVGDRVATIEFDTAAVWFIEKLGDGRINLFLANDTANIAIPGSDTLGLQSGFVYKIVVNNIYTSEFNNFFVGFTKIDTAYADFEPKF